MFTSVGSLIYTLLTRKEKECVCKEREKPNNNAEFLYSPKNQDSPLTTFVLKSQSV